MYKINQLVATTLLRGGSDGFFPIKVSKIKKMLILLFIWFFHFSSKAKPMLKASSQKRAKDSSKYSFDTFNTSLFP